MTRLLDLPVLAVDCQTSGATPRQGSLLELGWMRPGQPADSRLVALPEGAEIHRAVTRVTGISAALLTDAGTLDSAWSALLDQAMDVAAVARSERAVAIIHYAQFERRWLAHLAETFGPAEPPLDVICTHEIARRLLPSLPRRGIRAVAGYFGFGGSTLRRATEHAEATAFIWPHLLELLAERHIETREALDAWLAIPAKRGKVAHREFPMPREVRLALPTDPGVYRLQRSNGDVLYVGKARSLRKRVNSHFQKQSGIAEYRLELLSQAKRVDVTICETPLEAALLEADEIKRLAPPYNKALLEGERRAVFANRDFSEVRDRPSRSFAVGPITSRFAVGPIRLLVAALAGEPLEGEARSWVLGVGPDRAPPDPLFDAGLVAFRQRWGDQLITPDGGLSPDALYRTGAALMDCDLTVPDRVGEGPEWTEETVVRSLAMVVDTAARLARRGRWLCQLRECSVAWTARDAATRRCLVITGGAIARSFEMELAAELPIPPGHATSIPDRRRGFDVWSYDRLRVLMTELRRVAGDDPDAAVRFGPGRPLWGVRLQRALAWI